MTIKTLIELLQKHGTDDSPVLVLRDNEYGDEEEHVIVGIRVVVTCDSEAATVVLL